MDDFKIIMLADDDYLTVKMDSVSVIGTDGTDDYNELENIPKINNVDVKGNKTLADYDIESASEAKKEFENLNSKINTHEKNADMHVSRTDRMKWDSGTTYTISKENLIIGGK
jgi:hypothetical protein|nr:MAG TPA: hypothetical protein [Caudoviricetes sp.]